MCLCLVIVLKFVPFVIRTQKNIKKQESGINKRTLFQEILIKLVNYDYKFVMYDAIQWVNQATIFDTGKKEDLVELS